MIAPIPRITGWILTIFGCVMTLWGLFYVAYRIIVVVTTYIQVPGRPTKYVFAMWVLIFGGIGVSLGVPAWWGGRRLRRLAGRTMRS